MAGIELKKAVARKEREVDYKISHLSTFADNLERASVPDDDEFNSCDHMKAEIQKLLTELAEMNRQLASSGTGSNTLTQQHMGRLQTYNADFTRIEVFFFSCLAFWRVAGALRPADLVAAE